MKTICFFSGDITRSGGTERVSTMIANALSRQGKYQILFLSLVHQQPVPFFKIDKKISYFALGEKWLQPGPGYLKLIPKVRRFLKEYQVDVIIDIDIVLDILSIPAAKKLPTKVISWEHSNYPFEKTVFYRKMILHYSVKRSDYVVTLTERDQENYANYLHRKERITAIYNPMEPVVANTGEKKENWILTVGRLRHIKGSDYIASVAPLVLQKHPHWKWLVLGDGEMRPYLEEQIQKYHLEGRLVLTGNVKNVTDYLQKAQIFVLPSRSEGLPMCLLEAKACRLPCVSFDIMTGPSEIIRGGKNGFLVPPFDCEAMAEKINLLIEDDALRAQFAQNTTMDIEKFQMDTILQRWVALLDEC